MNSTTVWRAGARVRISEGRGTVYELRGDFAVVKLYGGRKVTVRTVELQTGALS
jgi:hypothetical protein